MTALLLADTWGDKELENQLPCVCPAVCVQCLPPEVTLSFFCYLPPCTLVSASRVCRQWRNLARDDSLWRKRWITAFVKNDLSSWPIRWLRLCGSVARDAAYALPAELEALDTSALNGSVWRLISSNSVIHSLVIRSRDLINTSIIPELPHLRTLTATGSEMDPLSLATIVRRWPNLESVTAVCNDDASLGCLSQWRRLTHLDVEFGPRFEYAGVLVMASVSDDGLCAYANSCENLQQLTVRALGSLTLDGIVRAAKVGSFTDLRVALPSDCASERIRCAGSARGLRVTLIRPPRSLGDNVGYYRC